MGDVFLDDLPEEAVSGFEIVQSLNGRKPYAEKNVVLMTHQVNQDHKAVYRASSLRRERTGVHAKIEILLNDIPLRWSNFNVERDEDRLRLANAAHGMLSPMLKEEYPKAAIKGDLDLFCWSMWDVHLQSQEAAMVVGNLDDKVEFVLRPYLIQGGGTLLFAPPGRGKSYTLLTMAICVDAGVDLFWPVEQAKTLIVNLERSAASVRRRLAMVNFALGLDAERPMLLLNARGRSLADMEEAIKRSVDKHKVEFIALDSLSRAGMGGLTEDRTANNIMDLMNGLGTGWLALAHTPRKDETHTFGSVFYDAAADVAVRLLSERRGTTLGVGLQIVKENDIGPTEISSIAFEFDQRGLYEIRKARPGEFAVVATAVGIPWQQQVEDHLATYGKASATSIAEELGLDRTAISNLLSKSERFTLVERIGHSKLYGLKAQE
jgi:hypothetical protein|tara:strand:+ start:679 stop:1983 length:1305 start_codon:yes stop_codon:yes gene_type:complete